VDAHGELTEVHAQAVLMRAEGATYSRIAEELGISEAEAREYAPFPAQVNAAQVRDEMRVAIVMGDRLKLAEAYEQFGFTMADALAMHRETLFADKYFFDADTGKFFAKPDWPTRLSAIRLYDQVLGLLGTAAQEGDQAKPLQINMHHNTLVKVENLTGRKLLKEGDHHDGFDRDGNGSAGGKHLPHVRRLAEPLPKSAARGPKERDPAPDEGSPGRPVPARAAGAESGADGADPVSAPGPAADDDPWGDW
jgi:hypothetical protein